jgi:aquaporin Z
MKSGPLGAWSARWPIYAMDGALLGLFMISACAVVAMVEHPAFPVRRWIDSDMARRAVIGAAMGATAIALIHSRWGKRTGAHLNPAMTLTLLRLRRVSGVDAAGYITAQFMGATAGVAAAAAILGPLVASPQVSHVATRPGRYGIGAAWAAEFAISALLVSVVFAVNRSPRLARWTGWFAGAMVAIYITVEAPISGMSMNPARTFGSAVFEGGWSTVWLYFTAPPAGMLAAAECFRRIDARRLPCCKLSHCPHVPCAVPCDCLKPH